MNYQETKKQLNKYLFISMIELVDFGNVLIRISSNYLRSI